MKWLLFCLWLLPDLAWSQTSFEKATLRYFLDHSHPQTGLVRDKAPNFVDASADNRVASMAATGFGFAVLANAAERGLIDRSLAEEKILQALRFSRDHVPRRKGWFLHWVDWQTGERAWSSEYSPIDSALFIAGALYAAEIFPAGELAAITDQLYREMDFIDFMTDGGAKPWKRTLSLSYSPEKGYEPYQWGIYAEQQILLLLGLGHPTKPLPVEAWKAYLRYHSAISVLSGVMGHNMPLFIHQYSAVFFDFRNFNDGYANYFQNGVKATQLHREMVKSANFKTFKEGFWGVSAGEDPEGYKVYEPTQFRGTVCIGCAMASAMYLPTEVMSDLNRWAQGPRRTKILGRYGFVDSIDLERNWYSQTVIGITVGPAYMSMANMKEETSIWKDFMQIPAIKLAMKRAQER